MPRLVRGQRAGDGVVLLVRLQRHRRHDQHHVRIDRAGLMRLGAADHDAVGAPLDHAQVHVLVLLLGRALAAVAFDVGHGAVDDPVVLLHGDGEFSEARVVAGAELLVHVEGGGEHGIQGIQADAALEAGAAALPEQALHAHLVDQIVGALMQMAEAVDGLAGERGLGGHEIPVLRVLRQFIGERHRVHRGFDIRMRQRVGKKLSVQVDLQRLAPGEAVAVLLRVHHGHGNLSRKELLI